MNKKEVSEAITDLLSFVSDDDAEVTDITIKSNNGVNLVSIDFIMDDIKFTLGRF